MSMRESEGGREKEGKDGCGDGWIDGGREMRRDRRRQGDKGSYIIVQL